MVQRFFRLRMVSCNSENNNNSITPVEMLIGLRDCKREREEKGRKKVDWCEVHKYSLKCNPSGKLKAQVISLFSSAFTLF